jgi:hypothetical protein
MRKTYYVKSLKLVTPDAARELGLPATDAPVLVSPIIKTPTNCLEAGCAISYTPLAYQTGVTTAAQHYHAATGGIYFALASSLAEAAECAVPWGFVAFLELVGQWGRYTSRGQRCGRAEAVRISSIAVYAALGRIGTPLTEGILCERTLPPDLTPAGTLLPMASSEEQEPGTLHFRVRDGTVVFSLS